MPSASLLTDQDLLSGTWATSSRLLDTSMPTNVVDGVLTAPFGFFRRALARPCKIRAWCPLQLFGLPRLVGWGVTTRLSHGLRNPGCDGLSRPHCPPKRYALPHS